MAGRKNKQLERLPTSDLRLQAWYSSLKNDLYKRGSLDSVNVTTNKVHDQIIQSIDPDFSPKKRTFKNWVSDENYPKLENIENLKKISSDSASWLRPDTNDRGVKMLLTAMDYWFCCCEPERKPTLFDEDTQTKVIEKIKVTIIDFWDIQLAIDEQLATGKISSNIASSMLDTHSHSALPLYLALVPGRDKLGKDILHKWIIDLFISVIISDAEYKKFVLEGNIQNEAKFPYTYPDAFQDKKDFLGTSPTLIEAIGRFISFEENMAACSYLNIASYELNPRLIS